MPKIALHIILDTKALGWLNYSRITEEGAPDPVFACNLLNAILVVEAIKK